MTTDSSSRVGQRQVVSANSKFFVVMRIIVAAFMLIFVSSSAWSQVTRDETGGTITGVVTLQRTLQRSEFMKTSKDQKVCGSRKMLPRLQLGKDNGVRNVLVIVEGVSRQVKSVEGEVVTLSQQKCEYTPHILIVPLGATFEILNNDPVLHNVHGYSVQEGMKSVFNIAQPIKGLRTKIKQEVFQKPGLISLTCDAGHPWMSGYIYVAPHPYCTLTDVEGNYRLEQVPSGTYKIKIWHEGVKVIKEDVEEGKVRKYTFEEPYELEKDVTVSDHSTVTVNFDLTVR